MEVVQARFVTKPFLALGEARLGSGRTGSGQTRFWANRALRTSEP